MNDSILHKFYTIIFCCVLYTTQGYSQNNTIQWTAESQLAEINGTEVAITSNLSVQQSTFSWQQISNLSDNTTTFSIVQITGSWNWQDHTGHLNYSLTSEDGAASLSVTIVDDEIQMHLILFDADNNPYQNYVFTIDTLTNL